MCLYNHISLKQPMFTHINFDIFALYILHYYIDCSVSFNKSRTTKIPLSLENLAIMHASRKKLVFS